MQSVSMSKQRKDTSQPGQHQRSHSPNVITTLDSNPTFTLPPLANFGSILQRQKAAEENKQALEQAQSQLKKVTMNQFMRNVHSKPDLLFALQVKGKSVLFLPPTHLVFGVPRLNFPSRQALLLYAVPESVAGRQEEVLQKPRGCPCEYSQVQNLAAQARLQRRKTTLPNALVPT